MRASDGPARRSDDQPPAARRPRPRPADRPPRTRRGVGPDAARSRPAPRQGRRCARPRGQRRRPDPSGEPAPSHLGPPRRRHGGHPTRPADAPRRGSRPLRAGQRRGRRPTRHPGPNAHCGRRRYSTTIRSRTRAPNHRPGRPNGGRPDESHPSARPTNPTTTLPPAPRTDRPHWHPAGPAEGHRAYAPGTRDRRCSSVALLALCGFHHPRRNPRRPPERSPVPRVLRPARTVSVLECRNAPRLGRGAFLNGCPAASYSPTSWRVQYHRR